MEYFFPHPDDSRIFFQYNDEMPALIRKTVGHRSEQITLVYKNVNAEEFFFCLIKAKSVHIEDKYQGYAILDGKEFKIRKPYDCKWAIHQLFGITEDNPLIINDRREQRYIWPFSDEEMKSWPVQSGTGPFGKKEQHFVATPGLTDDSWHIRRIRSLQATVSSLQKVEDFDGRSVAQQNFRAFAEEADAEFEAHRKEARGGFQERKLREKDE